MFVVIEAVSTRWSSAVHRTFLSAVSLCRNRTPVQIFFLDNFEEKYLMFTKNRSVATDVRGRFDYLTKQYSRVSLLVFYNLGGDDTRVFIWNVSDLMMSAEPKPARQMETMHASNIFAYAFANK